MKTLAQNEVRELERFHDLRLPQACVAFLRGEDGILEQLVWEDPGTADPNLVFDCESLKRLRRTAERMLVEEQIPFALAPGDFVFHFRSGPRFLFFRCEPGDDDPPVLCCSLDKPAPQQVCAHFSDWAASLLAKPDKRAIISARELPTVSAHLNLAGLVPLEMQAELRQMPAAFLPALDEVESQLGKPLGACCNAAANLVVGFVLGVILLGLGVVVLGWLVWKAAGAEGASGLGVGVAGVLSGGAAAVGGSLITRAWRLSRSYWVVAAHGFSRVRLADVEMVAWSEIGAIRDIDIDETFPLLNVLARMLPRRERIQFEALTTDGRKYSFSANTLQQVGPLRTIFRHVATELAIPWSSLGISTG